VCTLGHVGDEAARRGVQMACFGLAGSARRGNVTATAMNMTIPTTPNAASTLSSPAAPQRVCAQPSISVMYAIGMFDSEAYRVYLVAAAPRPIVSSTTAVKPAEVNHVEQHRREAGVGQPLDERVDQREHDVHRLGAWRQGHRDRA